MKIQVLACSKHTTIHSKDKLVDVVYQNNPVYCRSHSVDKIQSLYVLKQVVHVVAKEF